MCRLDFFFALNRPWQLIKTSKTKFLHERLKQLMIGIHDGLNMYMSYRARVFSCNFAFISNLFLTYKCRRKPLLGNLFVISRIFFGRLRPEDIKYCHSWKLKTAESWNCWNFCRFFWWYQWYFPISFSALQLTVSVVFSDIIF